MANFYSFLRLSSQIFRHSDYFWRISAKTNEFLVSIARCWRPCCCWLFSTISCILVVAGLPLLTLCCSHRLCCCWPPSMLLLASLFLQASLLMDTFILCWCPVVAFVPAGIRGHDITFILKGTVAPD